MSAEDSLAADALVGLTWQLNVINVHVQFGDARQTFLEKIMEAYRQLSMMRPTIIVLDCDAAPSMDDRGGRPTAEDRAMDVAMQHMGLQDAAASV